VLSALTTSALFLGLNPLLEHIEVLSEIPLLDKEVAGTGWIVSLATLAPSVLVLIGGLKMLRFKSRAWAIAAAILAMIFPPLHLIGIPVGIWALVILTQQDVRNAFGLAANTPGTGGPASGIGTASKIAVVSAVAVTGLATLTLSIVNLKAAEDVRQDFNFVVPPTADAEHHVNRQSRLCVPMRRLTRMSSPCLEGACTVLSAGSQNRPFRPPARMGFCGKTSHSARRVGRPSQCAPWAAVIEQGVMAGLSAQQHLP
jgi:hypothetical protein